MRNVEYVRNFIRSLFSLYYRQTVEWLRFKLRDDCRIWNFLTCPILLAVKNLSTSHKWSSIYICVCLFSMCECEAYKASSYRDICLQFKRITIQHIYCIPLYLQGIWLVLEPTFSKCNIFKLAVRWIAMSFVWYLQCFSLLLPGTYSGPPSLGQYKQQSWLPTADRPSSKLTYIQSWRPKCVHFV